MKVRTMDEIQEDPAHIRVTVDVELSAVGTAAQANRIQVLEGELAELRAERDLMRPASKRDHDRIMALEALVSKVREAVWVSHLDDAMEKRHVEDVITRDASFLAEAVAFVRASVGQP